jgi:short subunit dehydrogenase-like uncharacterized protein
LDHPGLIIYGAYGYSGELIVERAHEVGLRPVLAGRDPAKLARLGERFELPVRAFSLDDSAAVLRGLSGARCLLNCAGPFVHTAAPLLERCLDLGLHYLDITGEIEVFRRCAELDSRARARGITVLPGCGFDVVPSDCLALGLKQRLPAAVGLTLAFTEDGGISRGTARTLVRNLTRGAMVRRAGQLELEPLGRRRSRVDFGRGPESTVAVAWGDVFTAFYTTGIPNIEVLAAAPAALIAAARLLSAAGWLEHPALLALLGAWAERVRGPTKEQRQRSSSILFGEARDGLGGRVRAYLRAPSGYALTAKTAVEAARRLLVGKTPTGFHTPAGLFGAEFIGEFSDVELVEFEDP